MALTFAPAAPTVAPFPTSATSWTVVDDDVVVVGGQVPSLAAVLEHVARAGELVPDARVLSDLTIEPATPSGPGALVVIDALGFEPGSSRLTRASRATLRAVLAATAGYEETLVWVGTADRQVGTELEVAELSRRRVTALHREVEHDGTLVATVRVELRDADLTTVRGAVPRPERRYALRIRPS